MSPFRPALARLLAAALRCALLAAITASSTVAVAQIIPPGSEVVHRHSRPGQPVINVYVWGAAGLAGVWEVEASTDLVELLSLARPQGIGVIQPGTIQDATVKVYRLAGATDTPQGASRQGAFGEGSPGPRTLVYSGSLDALLVSVGPEFSLENEDVVTIEVLRTVSFGWRDLTAIVGTAASVAILILRLL